MIITNCPGMDDQGRCLAGKVITCNYLKECELIDDCIVKAAIRNQTVEMFEVSE